MPRIGTHLVSFFVVTALVAVGTLSVRAPANFTQDIVENSGRPAALQVDMGRAEGLATLFADVAVDEEFVERHGTEWRNTLDLALDSANEVLKKVGVRVEMVSLSTWESNDDQTHMSRILDGVLATTQRGSGRLLLAVTCQDSVRFDGMARDSAAAVVARYIHDDWQRNGSLIAHEIAHLLGAEHHPTDEECESDGCLMEPAGYAHAAEWCDDHIEAIGAFLAAAV
ncbi:MAG: M12 family metallo-peptidase [Chloroflexi bacterium]|nr:M12 family metallo-peptidase [Chloroflexota bacterium]